MPIDIIYVATSDISSNTETEFTKLKCRKLVKAVHIKPTHYHTAFKVYGSQSGSDQSAFVQLDDGAGNKIGDNVVAKSGLTEDVTGYTSSNTISVQTLTVVTDTPDAAHEIQLYSENSFKCYDAISAGDILVLTVVLKGEYTGV